MKMSPEIFSFNAADSGDQVFAILGRGNGPAVASDLLEVAAAGHVAEALFEFTSLIAADAHFADKLFVSGRGLGLSFDVTENLLVVDHFLLSPAPNRQYLIVSLRFTRFSPAASELWGYALLNPW
jgi:hypothetical protein